MTDKNFSQIDFYIPVTRDRFPSDTDPVIEDAGAKSAENLPIAEGGQVADIADGDPNTRLQPGTDLITGDDSTFDSDTGNYTFGSGASIAGGKLVINGAVGSDATITLVLGTGDYEVIFDITDYTSGGVRIVVGGTNGTTRSSVDTFTETITGGGTTTLVIDATGSPTVLNIGSITVRLKDKFRIDMQLDRRVDVDAMCIVNHNMRDVLPTDERDSVDLYWDTDDAFAGSTIVVPTSIVAHEYRADTQTFLDFDGVDDKVRNDGLAAVYSPPAGSIVYYLSQSSITAASDGGRAIGGMWQSNNEFWQIILGAVTGAIADETITFSITEGGTARHYYTKDTTIFDGEDHVFTITVLEQSVKFYLDDVALTMETPSGANSHNGFGVGAAYTAGVIGARHVSGADASFIAMKTGEVLYYNRELTSVEAIDHYDNPQLYPTPADQYGDTTTLNVSNCENAGANQYDTFDGVSPTGFHAIKSTGGTSKGGTADEIVFTSGKKSAFAFNLVLSSGQLPDVVPVNQLDGSGLGASGQTAVEGFNYMEFDIVDAATGAYQFQNTAVSEFTISLIDATVAGAIAVYQPEGISNSQGTWFDRNIYDGTIVGAQAHNAPGNSIIMIQFDSINAQYWFAEINPDSLTFVGAYKMGQFELLQRFRPTTNPDATGLSETFDQSGIDANRKYGGGWDINERHDMDKPIDVAYSFFLEDDRDFFEALIKFGKKRVIPYTLNGDGPNPIYQFGRILGNPEVVPVASGAYTVQFQITQEV